jgi:hypothetical protein
MQMAETRQSAATADDFGRENTNKSCILPGIPKDKNSSNHRQNTLDNDWMVKPVEHHEGKGDRADSAHTVRVALRVGVANVPDSETDDCAYKGTHDSKYELKCGVSNESTHCESDHDCPKEA